MKYLYFERSTGEMIPVCQCEEKEVFKKISEYTHKLNSRYTIYYIRSWKHSDGSQVYDVGSHSEFFHLFDNPVKGE